MNQWQYDTICATIKKGAPALAEDLIGSLQTLLEEYHAKCKELEDTKAELESYKKETTTETSESKKEKNK